MTSYTFNIRPKLGGRIMGMPVIVNSDISRCNAITDLIESVALQQAALAHILNAEGEKLQHVIASECATPELLLETNKSVRAMVDSVAKIEMILQYKLGLFEDCLCEPCKHRAPFHPNQHCECKLHQE